MRSKLWGLVLCAGLPWSGAAGAQQVTSPAVAVPPSVAAVDRLTSDDATRWLDGFLPYAIDRGDVAGAVVTVIKDGEVLARRGYGHADVEKQLPVDPAQTLFRAASVSKVFTFTAVMQLVEAGKLDLDADINQYLDFEIPANGPPITLRHLLTHTAGFEASLKYMWTTEENAAAGGVDLATYVKRWVPTRIFAAGTVPSYSNYGTSLAGYIVQRVSGLPFADYIEQRVLLPLGMRDSSFLQPLPPRLRERLSQGYKLGSGKAYPFEATPSMPAGSLSLTADDMARFLIAHLAGAAGQDTALLKATTVAQMYTPQTRFAPPLSTMALGLYELDVGGERVLGHAGDTMLFHSHLYLFPDRGVGMFVSFNSTGRNGVTGQIRRQLLERFVERYFPAAPAPVAKVDVEQARRQANALAAHPYLTSRRSESGIGRTTILQQMRLVAGDDGALTFPKYRNASGQPTRFEPIAPWVWRATDSKIRLAAIVDGENVTGFAVDGSSPFVVFQRTDGYRAATWVLPLLFAALAIAALAVLAWPIAAIVRRRHGRRLDWPRPALLAWRASRVAAVWMLATFAAGYGLMAWIMADVSRLDARLDVLVLLLGVASVIAIVAGIATGVWNLWHSVRGGRGWMASLSALLLVLALSMLAYVLVLLGFASFATDF